MHLTYKIIGIRDRQLHVQLGTKKKLERQVSIIDCASVGAVRFHVELLANKVIQGHCPYDILLVVHCKYEQLYSPLAEVKIQYNTIQ